MLTVPEAARRCGRNPETVRRWIREGKLRADKVGTQWFVREADLDAKTGEDDDVEAVPLPDWWPKTTAGGSPMPSVDTAVRIIREMRESR